MAAPNLNGWQSMILQGIGAPVTTANLAALNAWERSEGYAGANNPFATTLRSPFQVGPANSAGVRAYATPQTGIDATISTLLNTKIRDPKSGKMVLAYGNVLAALRKGTDPIAVANAVGASKWGTSGALMRSVLGSQWGGQSSNQNAPSWVNTTVPTWATTPTSGGASRRSALVTPAATTAPVWAQPPVAGGGKTPAGGPSVIPKGYFAGVPKATVVPKLPAGASSLVDTNVYPSGFGAGGQPGAGLQAAVDAAGGAPLQPWTYTSSAPTWEKGPNVGKLQMLPTDYTGTYTPLVANQIGLPSNVDQLVHNALTTLATAPSQLNYNTLLQNAMKQASAYIQPQLAPLLQSYQQGLNTIGTYTKGATEAANQLVNQIGTAYGQAEGETSRISQQVQAMLGGQNPLLGEGVVDPGQAAQNAAQAQTTFGGGGNVLGGIAAMGIPGLAADAAAAKSYAASLPSVYQAQAAQASAALGAATSSAEAKVLAGIPGLATKIASGQMSANKSVASGAKDILSYISGVQKFNIGQLSSTDKANMNAFFKSEGLGLNANRLNLDTQKFAADTWFKNYGVNQRNYTNWLAGQNLSLSQWKATMGARQAAVNEAVTIWKAEHPASGSKTSLGSQAVMNWWTTAADGKPGPLQRVPKYSATAVNPKTGQPLQIGWTSGKATTIGQLSFNDAVRRFSALHPELSEQDVIAMATQFYPSIGFGDRPLDPGMSTALRSAGALDQYQTAPLVKNGVIAKQLGVKNSDITPSSRIAYLGVGQMRVLLNAKMVGGSYQTGFQFANGQQLVPVALTNGNVIYAIRKAPSSGSTPATGQQGVSTTGAANPNAAATAANGYVNPYAAGANIMGASVDQGLDVLQSQPYLAPASGTIVKIDPNWYNGTPNIYEKFDQPIVIGGRVYPGAYFGETSVPAGLKVGDPIAAGQVIAGGSRPGSGLGEQGFAAPVGNNGTWMQSAYGRWNENMRTTTAAPGKAPIAAQDWLTFIRSLMGQL